MPPPASDAADLDSLAERLAADMRQRWQAGERPTTDDYLALYPPLQDQPAAAAELICEEIRLRREDGQANGSSVVLRRYPQWASRLRVLLELHDALPFADDPDLPDAGEMVGDFHLVAELGRGLRGRVFLARQPSLGGRPVVVKLTGRSDAEHHVLARLQHTHIVPIYAADDDPERRLRVLVMPFFGGASLAAVLDQLAPVAIERRTADDLWQALAAIQPAEAGALGARLAAPARARAGYSMAICWIGACLADALAFAHERGLLHLDVKPANVLLTAEGLPMLLDFHLARAALPAGAPAPVWLGGTPAYLSPEQGDALDSVRHCRPVATAVDGRSDLYSLGVVLYEALAGYHPGPAPVLPLTARNRHVSAGLSDIVARCLAARPEERYSDAAALADDLRRHLADLPLRGVPNRDMSERWRKWRRRRPHTLGVLGLLIVLLFSAALAVSHVDSRRQQARAALEEGSVRLRTGRFADAGEAFRRGLAVLKGLPFQDDLKRELTGELQRVERAEAVVELHRVTEQLRGLYGSDNLPATEAAAVEQLGERLWQKRHDLLDSPEPARADLLELALLWSHLRVRLAGPAREEAARREALRVLDELEQTLGPSAVLAHERAQHEHHLGVAVRPAVTVEPNSSWEYCALGCALLRDGDLEQARVDLERAVDLDPASFWAHFYLGRCDLRLGRHEDALRAFSACVALRPDNPLCYLHRGMAFAALERRDEALGDADRALKLDPNHEACLAFRKALVDPR
jgi:serine/threonine protein kinase